MFNLSLLNRVAESTSKPDLPPASELVEALVDEEKSARKEKQQYNFNDLLGKWNLRFITGTKKSQQQAGVVLGKGRYIPSLIKIAIAYEADSQLDSNLGRVRNSVYCLGIDLTVTGPIKFMPHKNILAFDFTAMTLKILGLQVYDGYISNGAQREEKFYQAKINQQAFFSYFLVRPNLIAARGRGGGLAIWTKD